MSTNVIRFARILGGALGSPFHHNLGVAERAWPGPQLSTTTCTRDRAHVPPAPDCHCGLWAAVSQTSLHRCLVALDRVHTARVRYMADVHSRITPAMLAHEATPTQRAAIAQGRDELERGGGFGPAYRYDWSTHAIVGCRARDARSEPACRPDLPYTSEHWNTAVLHRAQSMGCSIAEARASFTSTDAPPYWRRYRALDITHIWISDARSDYASDLRHRYGARIIRVPARDWLGRFIRTGTLPGLDAPGAI